MENCITEPFHTSLKSSKQFNFQFHKSMALQTGKSFHETVPEEPTLRSNTRVERRASALTGPGGCHHLAQKDLGQWAIPLAECWFGRRSPVSLLRHSVSWKKENALSFLIIHT
jgi:hypothetical protein